MEDDKETHSRDNAIISFCPSLCSCHDAEQNPTPLISCREDQYSSNKLLCTVTDRLSLSQLFSLHFFNHSPEAVSCFYCPLLIHPNVLSPVPPPLSPELVMSHSVK